MAPLWLGLLVGLSVIAIVALALIVRTTHRLPSRQPLHQDPNDLSAPLSAELAEQDAARNRDRRRTAV